MNKKILLPLFLFFFGQLNMMSQSGLPEVSLEGDPFIKEFNAASGSLRLVGIFSPTCGSCLSACADLQQFLEEHPEANIRVFLLWSPYMGFDTQVTARRSTEYLADSRVTHLWDVWRFGSRNYSENLDIPLLEAWDMYVAYPPGVKWGEKPPEPAFWLQGRELNRGIPYTPAELEAQLEKLLK